jgi:predicted transcriptional regulator
MVQSNEPVYFCDPHHKGGQRVLGQRYLIHIEGPHGVTSVQLDVCSVTEWGPKTGHDGNIQTFLQFLKDFGEPVHGAELLLPGERKVIQPASEPEKITYPQLNPPPGDEGKVVNPLAPPFSDQGNKKPPEEPKEEEEELPEGIYPFVNAWMRENGYSQTSFAKKIGISPTAIYTTQKKPPTAYVAHQILTGMGYTGDELQRYVLHFAEAGGAAKAPDWINQVRAVCKTTLRFKPCDTEVARGSMGQHARQAHGYPQAGYCSWELVGMPEGVEPVLCKSCSTPFPHPKNLTVHEATCKGLSGDVQRELPSDSPKEGTRGAGLHRDAIHGNGRTMGNNPVVGTAS